VVRITPFITGIKLGHLEKLPQPLYRAVIYSSFIMVITTYLHILG